MTYRDDFSAVLLQLDEVRTENETLRIKLNTASKKGIKFKLYKLTEILASVCMICISLGAFAMIIFILSQEVSCADTPETTAPHLLIQTLTGTDIIPIRIGEQKRALSQAESTRKWFEFRLDSASYVHFNSTPSVEPTCIKFCIWLRGESKILMRVVQGSIVPLPEGTYRFSLCSCNSGFDGKVTSIEVDRMIPSRQCHE